MMISRLQLVRIAQEAGQMILRFHDAAAHQKEGHFNFVTDADVAVQDYVKNALLSAFPQARFFSEEQENEPLTDDYTFVVDPIDGTLNFMRHRNVSAVSIALLKNKMPILAAICNPYENEIFSAEKGCGAFCNDRPIHASPTPFENALVAIGTSPYNADLATKTMEFAREFLLQAGDIRRCGSAAIDLCDIACGRADIFFELRLSPWDVAAGALLVMEAGGVFHSMGHSAPYFDGGCGVLASNALCKERAEAILSSVM